MPRGGKRPGAGRKPKPKDQPPAAPATPTSADQQLAPRTPLPVGRRPKGELSVAEAHKSEILQRMANGESVTSIAMSLGYADNSGLVHRLNTDPEYQAALKVGVFGRIDNRERELEAASDNVSVTRAGRLLDSSWKWAERIDPERFGPRSQLQVTHMEGDWGDRLRRAKGRTIDVTPSQDQHATELVGESDAETPLPTSEPQSSET